MSNVMFDAREALIPGSVYDRNHVNGGGGGTSFHHHDTFLRHDQMSYIGPDRAYAAGIHLPVPVGMFMPPVPQPFQPPTQGR